VLADPPYREATYDGPEDGPARGATRRVSHTVDAWQAVEATVREALSSDAVIVVEHDARRAPPGTLAGLGLWRDRRHGAGAVAVYRGAGEETGQQDDE
jgi:16S rRNA G966 N2-methylase RsmD